MKTTNTAAAAAAARSPLVLLAFLLLVAPVASAPLLAKKSAEHTIDCRFRPGPTNVTLTIVNECGDSAKIRTCADNFTQCVGYMKSPNHYQDCPQRLPNSTTAELVLDNHRAYILIDCPNWWGPTIDNWWTVEPQKGVWPKSFVVPPPKNAEDSA